MKIWKKYQVIVGHELALRNVLFRLWQKSLQKSLAYGQRVCLFSMLGLTLLAAPAQAAESVSMVSLIANPDQYQGKRVLVSGFLTLEFENNALYLHADDFANSQYKNGLWIKVDKAAYAQYNRQYIVIEGEFDAADNGHMNLWSGTLKNVERVLVAPKPK